MASSRSAQQPAQQRTAGESYKEFETRMKKMASRLGVTDTPYFYKTVHKSTATAVVSGPYAYSLEFPLDFHTDHGGKFGEDATFETADSHRTWPIKITTRTFQNSADRVFAYGHGGWKAFLTDNNIKVGDILIFELIRWSHFKVVIGRSPVEVHVDEENEGNEDEENIDQDDSDEENIDQDDSDEENIDQALVRSLRSASKNTKLPLLPTFVVTIRRPSEPEHPENHFYLEKDLSLVVPSHFWESHSRMLEGNKLRLKGPSETVIVVKVEKTYDSEGQKIRLMHLGWKAFLLANNLAIGDVLKFTLIANSSFTIRILK